MAAPDRVVVVGDLHMSLGRDPLTGAYAPYECFREDEAFVRFLAELRQRAAQERGSWLLLVLGDFLDFLHAAADDTAWRGTLPSTSERASLDVLEQIARGHDQVLRALGRLAADGVALAFVAGNHDPEVARPSVQARLRELLSTERPEAAERVSFHPWIFHVPGLLYAEHGSQYHDINAVHVPFIGSADPRRPAELPPGSLLTLYLLALSRAIQPQAGHVEPALGPLLAAVRARPALVWRTLPAHGRFLPRLALRTLGVGRSRGGALRTVAEYAQEVELSKEAVVSIARRAALRPGAIPTRALRMIIERDRPGPASGYLVEAAGDLHRVLGRAGSAVPFYLFGHTHLAERATLLQGGPEYLNPGTWSSLLPRGSGTSASPARFGFVEIRRNGEGPAAELRLWDDEAGRARAYPLAETSAVSSP